MAELAMKLYEMGSVHTVPVETLRVTESPRSSGENAEHIRMLAGVLDELPPIIVHRRSMRVVDGVHRLRAAQLRGRPEIEVRFFDGDDSDAFVLAVRANVAHGMPLSLADRKAAAARIVASHSHWSDRMIATVAGLSAATVARIRLHRADPGPPGMGGCRPGRAGARGVGEASRAGRREGGVAPAVLAGRGRLRRRNPVACKVGPSMTAAVGSALPPLVAAVRAAGHPVIWLTDPMHGNTVRTRHGLKTRYLETITQEVRGFQDTVRAAGGVAGGLHLETTPDHVTECVHGPGEVDQVGDKYTSLCDPRLTVRQAASVVSAWSG